MRTRKSKPRTPRLLARIPQRILALDLSLRATGAAILDPTGTPLHWETIETTLWPIKGAARLVAIRNRVVDLIERYLPDEIVVEFYNDAHHSASSTQAVWLHGVIHAAIYDACGRNALYIAPATLKKWMTGRGNKVEKPEMVTAIGKQYGVRIANHNAAEAFGLGCLALERARHVSGFASLRGRPFNAYEKKAMLSWRRAF